MSRSHIILLLQISFLWPAMSAMTPLATRGGALLSLQMSSRAVCSFVAPVSKRKHASWDQFRGATSVAARQKPSVLHMSSSTSNASYSSSQSGKGFGKETDQSPSPKDNYKIVDVPLVFVPGMKGTHLAFDNDDADSDITSKQSKTKKKRAWLTLGNLLNFPPRPDNDPARDLSLPLTYDYNPPAAGEDGHEFASHYPRQHRGKLGPDGIVDHIIELNVGSGNTTNYVDLNFLPFYGHTTKMLRDMDKEYHSRRRDGKKESTESFQNQDDEGAEIESKKGIFDRAGSFVERTSNWAFSNKTNSTAEEQQSHLSKKHCRPTAVFSYDWRRPLPELCTALNEFCEETFPDQPVQIIAHSLGGLMSFAAMRENPEKYAPGAVVVGVPFETGIQYLQDLHKGYFTELDRCRQFTPDKQFTMSSHWSFFPITKERLEDRFLDVTEEGDIKFDADKSGIGKKAEIQPAVKGENAYFDFYKVEEWERLGIGIFGPEYDNRLTDEQIEAYKEHMQIQMDSAKKWRQEVLGEGKVGLEVDEKDFNAESFPPMVAFASDAVPTVNQILRRKRKSTPEIPMTRKGRSPFNPWEYDYINGRAVPGDGRIDFDKAFPPGFVSHKRFALDSAHAKQMCWEESGGNWGKIYEEVIDQAEEYLKRGKAEQTEVISPGSDQQMIEEIPDKSYGRNRSVVNRMAVRARYARKRLRRKRSGKSGRSDPELAGAARASRRSFPFRRRRS